MSDDGSLFSSKDYSESIYSVTEITEALRQCLESEFPSVSVVGEISNLKLHSSGHVYFSLRDESNTLKCVLFRRYAESIGFAPAEGDKVIATGRVSHYGGSGQTQLIAYSLIAAGRGLLEIEFRKALKKLVDEGLTSPARKRPVPKYPERIGVITSPTGAVIKDIRNTIGRRWPLAQILLIPCDVQGDNAVPSIMKALEVANGREDLEVVILARGGGSIEDLWAFNSEDVARAVARSVHPIVTGIGHEIDTTLADYVSDLRASTPTAAAELVTPDKNEVKSNISEMLAGMSDVVLGSIEGKMSTLSFFLKSAAFRILEHRIENLELSLDDRVDRLVRNQLDFFHERNNEIELSMVKIKSIVERSIDSANGSLSILYDKVYRPREAEIRIKTEIRRLRQITELLEINEKVLLRDNAGVLRTSLKELKQLNPANVLRRGYTYCTSPEGNRFIKRVSEVKKGEEMSVNFFDGATLCKVEKLRKGKR